ncbi:MAG: hypothetical protein LBK01_06845 [Burkholderiaceae bacterium]|jgi:hypothetical protein|nr:hypothetical protein [Burkholderiaceae bacterium]
MLMTLLSMIGGGLMRLAPEVFSFLNKSKDYSHELAMMDKQMALDEQRARLKTDELRITADNEQALALYDARAAALASQMQKTGIRFVDALNFLVRPLTTYYFLLIYGLAKLAVFVIAASGGVDLWQALLQLYGEDDRTILAGVISFWFVGRVLDRKS